MRRKSKMKINDGEQEKQDREEWVRMNTCKFCVGSRLHSCTGYDCRDALKDAEEYFDRRRGIL